MINYLLVFLSSASAVSQSTLTKLSSKKGEVSLVGFNFFKSLAACLLFLLLSLGALDFHLPTLAYAAAYGVSLLLSTLFGFLALSKGSMAITSLICSYSIVIPCAFGIAWLHEAVRPVQYAGFALLALSMLLLRKKDGVIKFERGWGACVAVTFICNGICSVVQKLHQVSYPGQYLKEFSLMSTLLVALVLLAVGIAKRERPRGGEVGFALPAGALMGLANYLSLMLSSKMDATVLFPLITVFTVLLNCTVSKIMFKDKFTLLQILGILLGAVSVILIK